MRVKDPVMPGKHMCKIAYAPGRGSQPVSHDTLGEQTILSQGSYIRYPACKIFTL